MVPIGICQHGLYDVLVVVILAPRGIRVQSQLFTIDVQHAPPSRASNSPNSSYGRRTIDVHGAYIALSQIFP